MGRHDQLFKDLLRAFFPDFLALVMPEAAIRLEARLARFLETEVFTDLPEGQRRQLDLLAAVPQRGAAGPEDMAALVHVEIEARPGKEIGPRLGRYAMQVRLRHGKPLLSVLLALRGGRPGLRIETVAESLYGFETSLFRYVAFRLERCRAEDYLARPEPLAWALAARMRPAGSRAAHKLACLKAIAAARGLRRAQRFLLLNCVETYLQLTPEETAEYEALRSAKGNREVRTIAGTWADEMMEKGRKEGIREVVLRLLARRFGPLPEEARRRVEAISSPKALARLADKVLVARSLEEMGLA